MNKNEEFINELNEESISTRKMLERIPAETFDWKPHEKSMSMQQLATLTAMMFGWFGMMAATDELDFEKGDGAYPKVEDTDGLVKLFDEGLRSSIEAIEKMSDTDYEKAWILRSGDTIHQELSRYATFRQTFSHLAHHRGQLSVYMRLRDIPVPSIYGPTADEQSFA